MSDHGQERPRPAGTVERYDVAILGSGIGGSMLAAVLARQGRSVLLAEEGTHPRFAVGESVIPETAAMFRVVASRFGVPEIDHISTAYKLRRHVSSACGMKRAFSYVYQREGRPQDPREITQFPTLSPPFGPDAHLFRQDVDAYLAAAAVRHGATLRQKTRIEALHPERDGFRLEDARGRQVHARYVVDASGYQSPLAKMYGLRDDPCRLATDSRSLFTHMVGVRPYDQVCAPRRVHRMPVPFSQSTLHHVFPGGWLWVIPFDNSPDSTNPLCSVGLQLDRRLSPAATLPPEEEFRDFVARHPDLGPQFEHARAVREWTSAPRLQYSSRRITGERFCLLAHAGGFIDPLFSSGMGMTVGAVNAVAEALLGALAHDDFSAERFAHVETWGQRNLDHFDRVVACAYDSFRDFRLWNAWFRVWTLGNFLGALGPINRHVRFTETGDRRHLDAFREPPMRGIGGSDLPEFHALFDSAAGAVEAVRRGERTHAEAAEHIFALMRETDLAPPQMHLGDPDRRATTTWTLFPLLRYMAWGKWRAPECVRRAHFDVGFAPSLLHAAGSLGREAASNTRSTWAYARDMLTGWNREWRPAREPGAAPAFTPRPPAAPAAPPAASAVVQLPPGVRVSAADDAHAPAGATGAGV